MTWDAKPLHTHACTFVKIADKDAQKSCFIELVDALKAVVHKNDSLFYGPSCISWLFELERHLVIVFN